MNFRGKNSQRVQNVFVILTVPPFLAMDGGEKWTESVISFLVMQFREEVKCGSAHIVAKASFLFGARLLGLLFQLSLPASNGVMAPIFSCSQDRE